MSSPSDNPGWVDPAVKEGTTTTTSVDIESPEQDEGAAAAGNTLTILANVWRYSAIAANGVAILLLLLSVLESPLAIHADIERILFSLVFAAGMYGAHKFMTILILPSILVYWLFILAELLDFSITGIIIYAVFCIPQLMLVREIRRGVQANAGEQ